MKIPMKSPFESEKELPSEVSDNFIQTQNQTRLDEETAFHILELKELLLAQNQQASFSNN
jgi:hypothetical protein